MLLSKSLGRLTATLILSLILAACGNPSGLSGTYEADMGEPAAIPAASGTWWFQTPGPRYRVKATCGCGYKVPGVRTLPAPNAGGSAWVMAPKFLLACVK